MAIRPYEQALSFVCQLGATTAPTATNDGSASAGIGTDLLKQVAITGSGDVSSSSRSESGTDLVKLLGGELLDVVLNNNLGKGKSTDGGSGGGMVWMDPKTVNFAVYSSVSQDRRLDKVLQAHDINAISLTCCMFIISKCIVVCRRIVGWTR